MTITVYMLFLLLEIFHMTGKENNCVPQTLKSILSIDKSPNEYIHQK